MAAPMMGTRCRPACISPSSRRRVCSCSSGSSFGESEYGTRYRRHRDCRTIGPPHRRLSLGPARRPAHSARLWSRRAAPARGVRAALASGGTCFPDALPPPPPGRAADARGRAQVHDPAPPPRPRRTAACHWVQRGDLRILLDCGAGALHRLAEFGLPWHQVSHVILTHFHPDHWGELPMLVYALKYTTQPPRREPFVILGPPGVVQLMRALAEGYGDWLLDPGFPIGILDVRDGEPFPLDADVSLETFPVPHTTVSVG